MVGRWTSFARLPRLAAVFVAAGVHGLAVVPKISDGNKSSPQELLSVSPKQVKESKLFSSFTAQQRQLREHRRNKRNPISDGFTSAVPEVRHYKAAGNGYYSASPLYGRQESWRNLSQPWDVPRHTMRPAAIPISLEEMLMPASLICVASMTCQFFAVHVVLFLLHVWNRLPIGLKFDREERSWTTASDDSVFFVPMLCVLFLGTRLRALQLTQGHAHKYGLPQWWVKIAMAICTCSVWALTILVVLLNRILLEIFRGASASKGQKVERVCRQIILSCIYACFTVICIGLCVMQAPSIVWGDDGQPRVSAAMGCIMIMALVYFSLEILLACEKVGNDIGLLRRSLRFGASHGALINANAINRAFAPQLSALFITARMRALQWDPVEGKSHISIQVALFICTAMVLVQTLLAVGAAGILRLEETIQMGHALPTRGTRMDAKARTVMLVRFMIMLIFYIGILVIVLGVCLLKPHGSEFRGLNPPMPPSLQCALFLTVLYFGVSLVLWVLLANQKTRPLPFPPEERSTMTYIHEFVEVRAKEAVGLCPMLAILFLATLLRAQQLSGSTGTPQGWCLDLQVLASISVLFRTFLPPIAPLHWTFSFVIYASAIAIIVALYTMTDLNANSMSSYFFS